MDEMALVLYSKPTHFQCTHKYALSIPRIFTVFPGFLSYSRDSHRIPGILIVFPGFPSYSQGFGIPGICLSPLLVPILFVIGVCVHLTIPVNRHALIAQVARIHRIR